MVIRQWVATIYGVRKSEFVAKTQFFFLLFIDNMTIKTLKNPFYNKALSSFILIRLSEVIEPLEHSLMDNVRVHT